MFIPNAMATDQDNPSGIQLFLFWNPLTLVFCKMVKRGSIFHVRVGFSSLVNSSGIQINGNFVLVSDQTSGVNLEGLLDCFHGLWDLLGVSEQIIAFEFPGMMFPRGVGNGLAMKT